MMGSQRSSFVEDKDEKYAHLWFASLCKFHNIPDNASPQWDFDVKHVLAFLRAKLADKMTLLADRQYAFGSRQRL